MCWAGSVSTFIVPAIIAKAVEGGDFLRLAPALVSRSSSWEISGGGNTATLMAWLRGLRLLPAPAMLDLSAPCSAVAPTISSVVATIGDEVTAFAQDGLAATVAFAVGVISSFMKLRRWVWPDRRRGGSKCRDARDTRCTMTRGF